MLLCDKLIIAIARNSAKQPLFTVEERIELLRNCCTGNANVEIVAFEGLLVDYCRENDVTFIIRGLRALVDFEYEYAIALMNKKLAPALDTVFLMSRAEYSFVSNIVKEARMEGYHPLVPQFVTNKQEKFSRNTN